MFDLSFSHPPIDIHSHFNHGSPFDCPVDDSSVSNDIHCRDLDFVMREHAHLDICCGGFSTFASVMHHPECIEEENEYLHELSLNDPHIFQWVVIDPRQPKTYLQAEKMLASPKTLGIKIHPSYHGYDIEEYAHALFSFAHEHKTVTLMHPSKIEKMSCFADMYPDMKLIIAHLGSKAHVEAIQNARHGNLFTDTSGSASGLNNVIEYAVGQVGSEKILFGTDTYSCAFQFGRVALSRLSDSDKENILFGNALRLFPHAFQL